MEANYHYDIKNQRLTPCIAGLPPSHYPSVSPHLVPSQASAAAILQYNQLSQYQHLAAAAALGISPESLQNSLMKQNYPGIHPATDLLLERERQIAQERDRALRSDLSPASQASDQVPESQHDKL